MMRLLMVSLLSLQGALALSTFAQESRQEFSAADFYDPNLGGGSLIDVSTTGKELVEPLNVIISGLSSPAVLTDEGFTQFAKAIGFGPYVGEPQAVNLGDGNGFVYQALELVQEGVAIINNGPEEYPPGFDYLRLFRQDGPNADTGALFLALIFQEDDENFVDPNGYDFGRDKFVRDATLVTSYRGVNYQVVAKNITGLIAPGTPVGPTRDSLTDGVVALLTITIVP